MTDAVARTAAAVLVGLLWGAQAHCGDIQGHVDDLLDATASSDNARVSEGERSQIIQDLRQRLISQRVSEVEREYVLLVKLGDQKTMDELCQMYEGPSFGVRRTVQDILGQSRQPLVIPLLARNLQRQEGTGLVRYGEDIFARPLSVESSDLIRCLLTECPQFGESVKKWAGTLSARQPDVLRESMREWWRENEQHFQAGDYSAVSPPSSWVAPESGQEGE